MNSDLLERVPLDGMRAMIARRMGESLREMAQLTLHRHVATEALAYFRDSFPVESRPSVNDIIMAAAARVLPRHPLVNATLEDSIISRWRCVNLGIAVALADGLVVPVIRDAHQLSLEELRVEAKRLARAAHDGRLSMREIEGGTFTVSNLGALGVDAFTPIVNPPQVAILGVGRIHGGSLTLSLTIDHRALDGAPGALFLEDLSSALESPDANL